MVTISATEVSKFATIAFSSSSNRICAAVLFPSHCLRAASHASKFQPGEHNHNAITENSIH